MTDNLAFGCLAQVTRVSGTVGWVAEWLDVTQTTRSPVALLRPSVLVRWPSIRQQAIFHCIFETAHCKRKQLTAWTWSAVSFIGIGVSLGSVTVLIALRALR